VARLLAFLGDQWKPERMTRGLFYDLGSDPMGSMFTYSMSLVGVLGILLCA
jgi:hypothetical protein